MARFYARFDSGSPSWSPNTDTGVLVGTSADGYFNQYRIADSTANAALLRGGLIASRSAVSTDFYQELDSVNQNGALGIFFPTDQFQITAGILTASAYTASATNTQGIFTPANYRTRPTASITSSQTTLIGPTNPLDSGSVNYNTYLNASSAVTTVLNAIQTGQGVSVTPFLRQGNQPSRTLHSIWHDPDLQYFAWDDLTPGTPQTVTLTETSSTDFYFTNNFNVTMDWGPNYEYRNDEIAQTRVRFEFFPTGSAPVDVLNKTNAGIGAKTYTWTINQSNITTNGMHRVIYGVNFRDAQVIAEGGTNIGDGVEAGGTGSMVNYTRLYAVTLAFNGSYSSNCGDYTGATTRYTTRASPTTPGSIQEGDPLYTNTNVVTVNSVGNGFYRSTATNEVYQIAGGGVESPIQTCT
jgi:hypothetical protein